MFALPAVPQEVPYGVASWQEEGRGNLRVIVEVTQSADAVRVRIPWRWRDPFPEWKAILVFDSATGKQVANVAPIAISQEYGEIVFQPATVPGRYEIYYLPYDPPHWVWDVWGESTKGKYFVPKPTADTEWLRRNRLTEQELAQEHWRSLPEAKALAIQARTEFDRFDPMEVIATRQEVDALLAKYPQSSYLTFPEDRQLPVRMFEHLPYRWILEGPSTRFEGEAQPGEFYPFQIGIYAARKPVTRLSVEISDLRGEGGRRIPASAIRCFNLQGTDWLGRPMHREFSVTVGRVRPLWVGVQIPEQAKGVYRGTLRLRPEGVMKRYNPNSRIDFHSGDNWSRPWLSEPPLSSPANEYMEHFPYLDTLWFAELYDYNMPPDYWLVEISGLPFGLMGDMLQDGGNPYRGMIYGMTGRDRSNTTPGIWQMWDDFGILQERCWATGARIALCAPTVPTCWQRYTVSQASCSSRWRAGQRRV